MKANARIRRVAVTVALLLAGSTMALPASAQEWPARTVTVVVPLGAGSASDIMARVVAEQLSKQLGQTFVVENRPGAGGTIGAGMVAKAAPDGYTILAYGALATAHALHAKLPYDTLNDFVPVIPFGQQPLVVVTRAGQGLQDARRPGRRRQGEARRAQLFVGRHRIGVAFRRRAPARQRRDRGAAHRLQGRRRGGDRSRRRTRSTSARNCSPRRCRCCATASSWRSR